jgi:HNH endonuclease
MSGFLSDAQKAANFYEDHYDLQHRFLVSGQKVTLGYRENRRCRFCGKDFPEVTFKNRAHAIPEMLGNTSLFTAYECDRCNKTFGDGIETDFGNWSKPMRTLCRIRGKSGVPTIKRRDGGWRIEGGPSGLSVKHSEEDPAFEVDEEKKEMVFRLIRDPYSPLGVAKTFVKMGLSLLPESEMPNFQLALRWLMAKHHPFALQYETRIFRTLMPGPFSGEIISLMLSRRKRDDMGVPYSFLVICYGNEMFQVFLPSPERDNHLHDKVKIPRFPCLLDMHPKEFGPPEIRQLDLSGEAIVKDDLVTATLTFKTSGPVVSPGPDKT